MELHVAEVRSLGVPTHELRHSSELRVLAEILSWMGGRSQRASQYPWVRLLRKAMRIIDADHGACELIPTIQR